MSLQTRRFSLLILSFFLLVLSYGQKNFQPGYLVTASNDTLRGFIDYRNWDKNPDRIAFSRSLYDSASFYKPKDLKMFTVGNEIYETGIVTVDNSAFKTENLTEGAKYNYITDTVFLLGLVKGEKSLYYLKDVNSKEHFFILNNSGFELLLYKRFLKRDEMGGLALAEDKRYIGQLMIYLQDCPGIAYKFKDTRYEKKSLMDLFLSYHSSLGISITAKNTAVSRTIEFGVFAGLSVTKFEFFDGPLYLNGLNYPSSENITAGLFFNLLFPRSFGRMSFYNEFQYSSFQTEATFQDQYHITTTRIGMHYIQMNNMFRYKYPQNKAFIFINIGVSSGYGFNPVNYKKQVTTSPAATVTEGCALEALNPSYLGIPMGVGLAFKKCSFEARYQSGFKKQDDFNVASHPYSNKNAVYLLLGYKF